MKIGDNVKYQDGKKEKTGVIHGIKKADLGKGEVVIGYLVDTGKTEFEEKSVNSKGKKETFRQPKTVDLTPEQVTLA